MKKWILLIISILGLSLLGCNSKSSSKNLFVDDVLLQTEQAMEHGGQFTVKYTLNVTNIVDEDVNIDFYMISTSSTPADVGNTSVDINNAHLIKSSTTGKVSSGTYQKSVDLIVPNVDGIQGEYKVVVLIDPNDTIDESNEDDNWLTLSVINGLSDTELVAVKIPAFSSNTIIITAPPANDITIDSFNISTKQIVFDAPANVAESELRSHLVGYIEVRDSAPNMSDSVLQAQAFIGGVWQPLYLWNADPESSGGEYKKSLLYQFEREYNQAHLGFDVFFPLTSRQTLYDGYDSDIQNKLRLRFSVIPAPNEGIEDSELANNSVEVFIPYYFFKPATPVNPNLSPNPNPSLSPNLNEPSLARAQRNSVKAVAPIELNKMFNQTYGNKNKIAVGIQLDGGVTVAVDPTRLGGSAYTSGGLNVYFFNFEQAIVGVNFKANAYLLDETGYLLAMTFLNTTVFSREYTQKYDNENKLPTWTVSHAENFERSRDIAESTFFVGPVPLTVSAGVTGNVGFNVEAGYDSQLFIKGDILSAKFSGYANGGIKSSLVTADIEINMIIIENNFTLASGLGLISAEDLTRPVISYQVSLVDKLNAIEGRFGLTAAIAGIKWCKIWAIPYPCGTQQNTYNVDLYKTLSLFDKEFTLFSKEGEIVL
jgi:hypothetical protein